jgi:hypothetical protein
MKKSNYNLLPINIFELIEAKHLIINDRCHFGEHKEFLKLPKSEQNHGQPPHPFV